MIVKQKETSCAKTKKKEQTFNYLHPHKLLQMNRWHQSAAKKSARKFATQTHRLSVELSAR